MVNSFKKPQPTNQQQWHSSNSSNNGKSHTVAAAMAMNELVSTAKDWVTPSLHATSTWACMRYLLAALLVWRKPTPTPGALVARWASPTSVVTS